MGVPDGFRHVEASGWTLFSATYEMGNSSILCPQARVSTGRQFTCVATNRSFILLSTTFFAIVLNYVGLYCEDSWSPVYGHLYVRFCSKGQSCTDPDSFITVACSNCFFKRYNRYVLPLVHVHLGLIGARRQTTGTEAHQYQGYW